MKQLGLYSRKLYRCKPLLQCHNQQVVTAPLVRWAGTVEGVGRSTESSSEIDESAMFVPVCQRGDALELFVPVVEGFAFALVVTGKTGGAAQVLSSVEAV